MNVRILVAALVAGAIAPGLAAGQSESCLAPQAALRLDHAVVGLAANDPDSVLQHPNGAVSLASAWLEGGPALGRLLRSLGSQPCGAAALPDGRQGIRWALARGTVVVVPGSRRRVVGVEIDGSAANEAQLLEPLPGFWVLLR